MISSTTRRESSHAHRAVQQSGNAFGLASNLGVASGPSWQTFNSVSAGASLFCLPTMGFAGFHTSYDCSIHPDFSMGAPDHKVGYIIGNSFAGLVGPVGNYESGIDNFGVETSGASVSTVPEPSTDGMMTAAAVAPLHLRRRRPKTQE